MFGCSLSAPIFPPSTAFDTVTYTDSLQCKLSELRDLVECHLTTAAEHQNLTMLENPLPGGFVWETLSGCLDQQPVS